MKRYACFRALLALCLPMLWLCFQTSAAYAETLETNDPNIVVKRVYCVAFDLSGVLVNRGKEDFHGTLNVMVRDEEGDIVGRNKIKLRAGAENGRRFSFYYINTMNCKRHKFEFKVDPEVVAQ